MIDIATKLALSESALKLGEDRILVLEKALRETNNFICGDTEAECELLEKNSQLLDGGND